MSTVWQASAARDRFSDLVDAAVEGRPQFVRRRDGKEVVVVSAEYFEKTKPNLRDLLLFGGFVPDEDDELKAYYAKARGLLGLSFKPASQTGDIHDEAHRHGYRQPLPEAKT